MQGSIELLPETRPEEINDNLTTLGVNGQWSYGFTNDFNLTLKGWGDIEFRSAFQNGFTLNAQFMSPIDEHNRRILLPKAGTVIDDFVIDIARIY